MLQAKLADGRAQEAEQKLEGVCVHVLTCTICTILGAL